MTKFPGKTSILVLALVVGAADAQACGEIMLRTGSAMRYHACLTHYPADVLVCAGPAAKDHELTGDSDKFRADLEKAGHKVTMIGDPQALSQALASSPYDVIIADAGDMDAVTGAIAKVQHEPTLIPVLAKGASDEHA